MWGLMSAHARPDGVELRAISHCALIRQIVRTMENVWHQIHVNAIQDIVAKVVSCMIARHWVSVTSKMEVVIVQDQRCVHAIRDGR